ncbi:MAG: DUF2878 domain-containing protein [Polynucleobacter sp.]|nr:DUF2878 domain-containing protein [Polynucleobacter sp.]
MNFLITNRDLQKKILNFIFFQVGWFACILGAAHDQVMVAVSITALCIIFHLFICNKPYAELIVLIKAVLLGLFIDTALIRFSWIEFHAQGLLPSISPIWMWMLWAIFASTLNSSMSWLQGRLFLALALGAIAGPLCYEAGVQLGAAQWVSRTNGLIYLAVAWGLSMPFLLVSARKAN